MEREHQAREEGVVLSKVLEGEDEAARWGMEGRLGQLEEHLGLDLASGSMGLGSAGQYANHFRSQG